MTELSDHLTRLQEIANRAHDFQGKEGSDPKKFSKLLVEDIGTLADALIDLIKAQSIDPGLPESERSPGTPVLD